ncbi:hypothetical protein BB561_005061 [Smittium simulii]|uniref:Uncharacterized protein n=1 Tax=Smittium simulii TaxID=133385 RepID=A0A2T9YCI6_9FUNG|nr:hypothetical protein BB561_005061 [Smittium simulii]
MVYATSKRRNNNKYYYKTAQPINEKLSSGLLEIDDSIQKVILYFAPSNKKMEILEIINQEYNQLTQSMHTPENSGQIYDYNNKLVHQYTTYSKNRNINGKQPITQSQT